MEASKENCQKARRILTTVSSRVNHPTEEINFLVEFLDSCEKRLPSQEAIDKDKQQSSVAKAAKEGYESGKKKA